MNSNYVNKKQWIELFRATGLTDEMMSRWHKEFEARNPEGHQEFLEWINIPSNEITEIRSL
ncbi:MAG: hypothetical protein ABW170_07330 [Candidatus Thiodiazotropha sp. L084R]